MIGLEHMAAQKFTILRHDSYKRMPWKNGGGANGVITL
jgi:environmental stress-induced protein Ves